MIALIDYGAGNLTSVRKALSALGAEFMTPTAPDDLARAAGIIVPGVGHFGATHALDEMWRLRIRAAMERGAAIFGICLGMQWLFEGSAEAPGEPGLGCFPGVCELLRDGSTQNLRPSGVVGVAETVRDPAPRWKSGAKGAQQLERGPTPLRISDTAKGRFKIPHVGWNSLDMPRASGLLDGVAAHTQVYFTHSYVAPVVDATAAVTTYGMPFTAAVERGRVAGVQFHPEKSGDAGLNILRNWLHAV